MLARPILVRTLFFCAASLAIGCGGDTDPTDAGGGGFDGGADAGGGMDAGFDAGTDAGHDAGFDAGDVVMTDAGADGGPLFACTLEELTPIFECAQMNCVMLPDASIGLPDGGLEAGIPEAGLPDASLPDPGELATCILTSCGLLVFGVSGGCRGCLLAGVGMDLETIAMSCAPGVPIP